MRTLHINLGNSPEGSDRQFLLNELALIEDQLKVYKTYCVDESCTYILTTGSKDMHLGFGLLSEPAQLCLCRILREDFEKSGADVILFTITAKAPTKAGEGPRSGALLTMTKPARGGRETISFLFAPTR